MKKTPENLKVVKKSIIDLIRKLKINKNKNI